MRWGAKARVESVGTETVSQQHCQPTNISSNIISYALPFSNRLVHTLNHAIIVCMDRRTKESAVLYIISFINSFRIFTIIIDVIIIRIA